MVLVSWELIQTLRILSLKVEEQRLLNAGKQLMSAISVTIILTVKCVINTLFRLKMVLRLNGLLLDEFVPRKKMEDYSREEVRASLLKEHDNLISTGTIEEVPVEDWAFQDFKFTTTGSFKIEPYKFYVS